MCLAACGDDSQSRVGPPRQGDDLQELPPLTSPSLRVVSPPEWAAGDTITVLGGGFVEPARGRTVLRFDGEFVAKDGARRQVDAEVPAVYRNTGRVELVFEPAAPPEGFGNELGTFTGEVTAVNADDKERTEPSDPVRVTIDVKPSLIVWDVAPEATTCANRRVSSTLSGVGLEIQLEALGLATATQYAPLRFTASWVDVTGQTRVAEQRVTSGRRARLDVIPGDLGRGQVQADVFVNLKVTDLDDRTLERAVSVAVKQPNTVDYDGNVRIAELYAPVQVSSCLPGGPQGRDYSYTGGSSESRSRSWTVSSNLDLGASFLWVMEVSFGLSFSDTVSSDESESLSTSGRVPAGQYGVFYRQTQRLERLGTILRHDACGATFAIGKAHVTDWNWAPDLALTNNMQCPPAPRTNLPPAQVFP